MKEKNLKEVHENMKPGVLTLEGFLGTDDRDLGEILATDDETVRGLGLTHAGIADALEYYTKIAREGFGTPQNDGTFKVVMMEPLGGWVRCPYEEGSRFRKGEVTLTNLNSGKTLTWTPMQIHMIRMHGFYEGRGSRYRLEPEEAKSVLQL